MSLKPFTRSFEQTALALLKPIICNTALLSNQTVAELSIGLNQDFKRKLGNNWGHWSKIIPCGRKEASKLKRAKKNTSEYPGMAGDKAKQNGNTI